MDEDSSDTRLVSALRLLDWDIVTTVDQGWARSPDAWLFERVQEEHRTVYTCNESHYARLAATWSRSGREHAGVMVRGPQSASPENQYSRLVSLASEYPNGVANLVVWAVSR